MLELFPDAARVPTLVTPVESFYSLVSETAQRLPVDQTEALARRLAELRDRRGRLFVLGVGGSAANASHAVNDFRKLCGIETYAPTDNVAELSARTNDEGGETTLVEWLRTSRIGDRDAVLVLSVGGGDAERGVSVNLIRAMDEAQARGATVLAIVGRDGGHAARIADVAVIVPTLDASLVTPIAESFQSVILHCLVSEPSLALGSAKWEGLDSAVAAGPAT